MTIRQLAISASRDAGAYLLRHFAETKLPKTRLKSQFELVTKFDLGANRRIVRMIRKFFPEHDILSEETGLSNRPGVIQWVVDPLDGTTNFAIRNPVFAVSLAVIEDHAVKVGVVYAPVTNDLYVAEKGKGASLNGRRLHVSDTNTVKHAIIMYGSSHDPHSSKFALKIHEHFAHYAFKVRRLGAASLDLAYVAAGRVDACVMAPPSTLWDIAAGVLLIQEAGGEVTDLAGERWKTPGNQVVATNGILHKEILDNVRLLLK